MFKYIHILSYYKLFLYFTLCLSVMLDTLSCSYTSISFLTTSCSFTYFVFKCSVGQSLKFIYIHVLSYYKLFIYILCVCSVFHVHLHSFPFLLQAVHLLYFLSVMLVHLHSYFLTTSCSLCLSVWTVAQVHLHSCPFLLQAVPLLYFVSKCNVGYSLMFIFIHIISYYKLFLYFSLCLRVMLDSLSRSLTFISFLTTSCSFTLLCV